MDVPMLQTLGFGYVSNDLALAMTIVAVIAATFMGWICDAVMRDTGFGVIGNAALSFLGGGAAVVLWNAYLQPLTASQPVHVVIAAAAASITLLMFCAVLRRML
jgi:uncharacterized membrane protein YeaQ/YmgE (transglycosylase-associated protein family)